MIYTPRLKTKNEGILFIKQLLLKELKILIIIYLSLALIIVSACFFIYRVISFKKEITPTMGQMTTANETIQQGISSIQYQSNQLSETQAVIINDIAYKQAAFLYTIDTCKKVVKKRLRHK